MITSELCTRVEEGTRLETLVWRLPRPLMTSSTAAAGGGLGIRCWIVNAQVSGHYSRCDPEVHVGEIARDLGLEGPGVGMMTSADVAHVVRSDDEGVSVEATVGISHPVWAASPSCPDAVAPGPGTINLVVWVPVPLGDAALLNTLCTATEAKSQALLQVGIPGTGTASDAVTVVCSTDGGAERFGGPRSVWGAKVARAVCTAVEIGCRSSVERSTGS